MEVQVLEFDYNAANVQDIESQINNYFEHHEVEDVQVTQWENQLLVFCFNRE